MSKPRVLIAEPKDFCAVARRILEAETEVILEERASLMSAFQDFDAVWVRLAHRIDAGVLGPSPRCRFIATPVTGTDRIDQAACDALGVRVLSLKGETAFLRTVRATAEMTIALLLGLIRRLPESVASARAGEWERDRFRGRELYGRRAGIVGVGRLGSIVAEYLRAMGMEVVGVDPRADFPHDVARAVSLSELLETSDVISLHVPYEPATRHLIDQAAFAKLKPGAVLVNTSRGGVVDEAAMIRSLEAGHLAGAAVDVIDGEPDIRPDHPVLEASRRLPNLLVTPHLGGNTSESFERTEVFMAKKLLNALYRNGPRE